MRSLSGRTRRYGHIHGINEINVMPLVDLLLQLFIAVIIFFPVVEYGMNINLPKGTTENIKREQTRTIAVDKAGRYYVTSALGVQVFDPTGRQCGVLPKPLEDQPLTSCVLAGPNHEYLYVTNGTTLFRRKVKVD